MGFGTGFVVHSFCGFAPLRKKWQGRQLRSPAWQSRPQKTTKISHFYTSYSNHLHTPNSRDIRPHPCRKSRDPTNFTASSVHLKTIVELILAFAIWSVQIWGDFLATWQVNFFPATIPKANFYTSGNKQEQKLSQSTNEINGFSPLTVPHVKTKRSLEILYLRRLSLFSPSITTFPYGRCGSRTDCEETKKMISDFAEAF